jgi:(2Fe-2S) ferredoxin
MSRTILVCQHETCPRQGATAVLKAFKSQAPSDVVVQSAGCLGECGSGPMVVVLPEEIWYCHVELKDVSRIVEQHLRGGKPVKEKLYPKFHPQKQSIKIWLMAVGLFLGFLGLLFWLIASQTYYL